MLHIYIYFILALRSKIFSFVFLLFWFHFQVFRFSLYYLFIDNTIDLDTKWGLYIYFYFSVQINMLLKYCNFFALSWGKNFHIRRYLRKWMSTIFSFLTCYTCWLMSYWFLLILLNLKFRKFIKHNFIVSTQISECIKHHELFFLNRRYSKIWRKIPLFKKNNSWCFIHSDIWVEKI